MCLLDSPTGHEENNPGKAVGLNQIPQLNIQYIVKSPVLNWARKWI